MEEHPNNNVLKSWILFNDYITDLYYLDDIFLVDVWYFKNLRLVSEVYYNINTNLNIIINDKETISRNLLNKKIGILYKNMQNLIKIIEKKNKKFKVESEIYYTVKERFKSVKLTIQKYFRELELKNNELEEKDEKKEKKEKVKKEKVKIIKDELNPNHIRFEYFQN